MIRTLISPTLVCLLGAAVLGQAPPAQPKIDPKAVEALKKMAATIGGLKEFTIQAEEVFDDLNDRGQKIQFSNRRRIALRRPNQLAAQVEGDTLNRRFVYDGKTVSLHEPGKNFYAVVKVPDNIEAMMDFLHEKYGVSQPLSDLFFADAAKVLLERVETGEYVGLHQVIGAKCHHLAFTQAHVDWQIWIDAGDQALPRKFLITYKQLPGAPQFAVYLHDWNLNPKLEDSQFQFQPPQGAIKIDMSRVLQPKQ